MELRLTVPRAFWLLLPATSLVAGCGGRSSPVPVSVGPAAPSPGIQDERYPGVPPGDAAILARQGLGRVTGWRRADGADGYTVSYSDGRREVYITRTVWGDAAGGPTVWKTAAGSATLPTLPSTAE